MAKGGKGAGENTKKAAGNAKKAEVAANKAAQAQAAAEANESASWAEGAKSNKKQQDAEAKRAEAERKKAEKAALLAEEEANQPSKPKNTKSAQKKNDKPVSRKLDLGQLEDGGSGSAAGSSINASGIDNALDALALTGSSNNDKVEKHPERRFKAAYAAFEAKRLPEIEEENPGLRKNQRVAQARKEFEKHPDNPFNQASVRYDATKEDIAALKTAERKKVEERLAG